MAERGIDIPAFNIDFTFFCALEKNGQCQFISNLLKKRIERRGLPKCNSIENLVSHSITHTNTANMRYTRLPCCNHEFHWPCLKNALLKAGYCWEEEEKDNQSSLFLPTDKQSFLSANQKTLKNRKVTNENDIIITDLEEEEEEEEECIEGEREEEIEFSSQSTSKKPTIKKPKEDEWIEIKCPVCLKINKIPIKALKSNETIKPITINRSRSLTNLTKSLSLEKLEAKKLTTYNSLINLCSMN